MKKESLRWCSAMPSVGTSLDGAEGVNYDLLRTIKDMTSHLEVNACTEGDWERAIMAGFDIWRQVKAKGKGRIHADLEQGTIELVG